MNKQSESRELEKRFVNFDPNEHFTITSSRLAQDGSLSLQAIGLYCYMASNSSTWKFSERALYRHFQKNGLWTVKKAVKELERHHFIKRTKQFKNKHGQWTNGARWKLYYTPYSSENDKAKSDKSRGKGNSTVRRSPVSRSPVNRSPDSRQPTTNKYQSQLGSKEISNKRYQLLHRFDKSHDETNGRNNGSNANYSKLNGYQKRIYKDLKDNFDITRDEAVKNAVCLSRFHNLGELSNVFQMAVDKAKSSEYVKRHPYPMMAGYMKYKQ